MKFCAHSVAGPGGGFLGWETGLAEANGPQAGACLGGWGVASNGDQGGRTRRRAGDCAPGTWSGGDARTVCRSARGQSGA